MEDFDSSEVWRANAIIEKAQRNDQDVVGELVSHMVSRKLIESLTGKEVVLDKKVKKRNFEQEMDDWSRINASLELTTTEIQSMLDISYAEALKIVKNNDYFVAVKRGVYRVRDGKAEREEAKKSK
jgi:hypothetical protein